MYQNTLQISYIKHRKVVVIELVCLSFRVCRTFSELKSIKSSSVVFMVVVKCRLANSKYKFQFTASTVFQNM